MYSASTPTRRGGAPDGLAHDATWLDPPDALPTLEDLARTGDGNPDVEAIVLATVVDAVDDGPSRTGDMPRRLGVGANYVSVYRARSMDAGLIRPAD